MGFRVVGGDAPRPLVAGAAVLPPSGLQAQPPEIEPDLEPSGIEQGGPLELGHGEPPCVERALGQPRDGAPVERVRFGRSRGAGGGDGDFRCGEERRPAQECNEDPSTVPQNHSASIDVRAPA